MLVNMFCPFLAILDLWTVFVKDQASGGEVTAYGLTYIVGAYLLIGRLPLELTGPLEIIRG
jgi:hypothetical protein